MNILNPRLYLSIAIVVAGASVGSIGLIKHHGAAPSPTRKPTTAVTSKILPTSVSSTPNIPNSVTTSPKPTAVETPKNTTNPASNPSTPTASPAVTNPAPTPTPVTPTPTPTPAVVTGWPNATNTGVPAGVSLHACATPITVSGTYDSCDFANGVDIRANNVTISRSFAHGQVKAGDNTQTGLVISDTTIDCGCGSTSNTTPAALGYSNFTLIRANIYNAGHGVQISDNVTVRDSYIHDLCCNNAAHKDGIISNGGGNSTLTHNNVECAADSCSAAVGLFGDFGPISRWTIDNNLFNTTGSYCLYGGDAAAKPYPTATYMTVTNNHFGRKYGTKCGFYGPVAYFNYNTGNNWSGNVWDDTGATVLP